MLMAASNDPDPQTFQDTEIYKRCVAAGIIPKSRQDLENRSKEKILGQRRNDTQSNATDPEPNVTDPEPGLSLDLRVQGMWCPACAWVIEETLLKQSGVCLLYTSDAADDSVYV